MENIARAVLKLYIENLNLQPYEVWFSWQTSALKDYFGDTKPELVIGSPSVCGHLFISNYKSGIFVVWGKILSIIDPNP
ncbi:hypothetical protein E2542_SST24089 [Spatholobus suberectus]|nr:hypothetical protein E2542_SST24089 [Spatholobus suberectus]